MSALFDEILFDTDIIVAGGATGGPEYANTLVRNPATGIYKVNVNRYDFQQVWNFSTEALSATQLAYLMEFWGGGFGSGYGFRLVVVSDFFVIDEVIGTGDGNNKVFNLIKSYSRPGASHAYSRRIVKPVVNTQLGGGVPTLYEPDGTTTRTIPTSRGAAQGVPAFTIKDNTVATTAFTVDNRTGVVTFTNAPVAGHTITWSGEFDTPVRFLQNSLTLKPDVSSDVQGLVLCEILPAELLA